MATATIDERLTTNERASAAAGGLLVLIALALLMYFPPRTDETQSDCTVTASEDCVVKVSAVPDAVTGVLAGAGGLLLLVAILGIRFRTLEAGGVKLSAEAPKVEATDESTATAAADAGKVKPVAPEAPGVSAEGLALVESSDAKVALWGSMPPSLQASVQGVLEVAGVTGNPWDAVEQVYRPTGANREWFVVAQLPNGERKVLRCAYSGTWGTGTRASDW